MANENSGNEPGSNPDDEITSSFPADGLDEITRALRKDPKKEPAPDRTPEPTSDAGEGADADSWVAQWGKLFDDPPPAGTQPPTREMPVFEAEQPPVTGATESDGGFPGHLDPSAAARKRPRRDDGDAAEIAAWQKSQERTKRRAKLRANQRKAQTIQRQRADGDDFRLTGDFPQNLTDPGTERKIAIAGGGVLLIMAAALIGYLFTGFGSGADDSAGGNIQQGLSTTGQDLSTGADAVPRSISDLALSTVQLVGLNDDLEPECAGSGVIVKSDGTILTNAHVVTSEQGCRFTTIGVGLTVDSTEPAQLLYRADVLTFDPALDLAVLRISGLLDPDADEALPDAFPAAPLGDSDTVELGDNVRILGYPVIGGETITLTTGTVSGFTSQVGLGTRALIKTDATISAGNSGGLAIDPDGRVVGIPTKARASESGPAIDCRPLADTNSDGAVDDEDNCVSVGGFLNGIRPINLALPLLGAAATARPIGPVIEQAIPVTDFDFDQVVLTNPRFSLGRNGNFPVDEVVTASAGIPELCFFVDWAGIPIGASWDGVWFVDGQLEEGYGSTNRTWTLEEDDNENFWICAQDSSAGGLPPGVYEIGFFLENTLMFAEGIELTEGPRDVVSVTWQNGTEGEICQLAVNPFSESGQVGLNELDLGVSIPAGASQTIRLPLGRVVAEAYNCQGEPVADAFAGLDVIDDVTFLIGL